MVTCPYLKLYPVWNNLEEISCTRSAPQVPYSKFQFPKTSRSTCAAFTGKSERNLKQGLLGPRLATKEEFANYVKQTGSQLSLIANTSKFPIKKSKSCISKNSGHIQNYLQEYIYHKPKEIEYQLEYQIYPLKLKEKIVKPMDKTHGSKGNYYEIKPILSLEPGTHANISTHLESKENELYYLSKGITPTGEQIDSEDYGINEPLDYLASSRGINYYGFRPFVRHKTPEKNHYNRNIIVAPSGVKANIPVVKKDKRKKKRQPEEHPQSIEFQEKVSVASLRRTPKSNKITIAPLFQENEENEDGSNDKKPKHKKYANIWNNRFFHVKHLRSQDQQTPPIILTEDLLRILDNETRLRSRARYNNDIPILTDVCQTKSSHNQLLPGRSYTLVESPYNVSRRKKVSYELLNENQNQIKQDKTLICDPLNISLYPTHVRRKSRADSDSSTDITGEIQKSRSHHKILSVHPSKTKSILRSKQVNSNRSQHSKQLASWDCISNISRKYSSKIRSQHSRRKLNKPPSRHSSEISLENQRRSTRESFSKNLENVFGSNTAIDTRSNIKSKTTQNSKTNLGGETLATERGAGGFSNTSKNLLKSITRLKVGKVPKTKTASIIFRSPKKSRNKSFMSKLRGSRHKAIHEPSEEEFLLETNLDSISCAKSIKSTKDNLERTFGSNAPQNDDFKSCKCAKNLYVPKENQIGKQRIPCKCAKKSVSIILDKGRTSINNRGPCECSAGNNNKKSPPYESKTTDSTPQTPNKGPCECSADNNIKKGPPYESKTKDATPQTPNKGPCECATSVKDEIKKTLKNESDKKTPCECSAGNKEGPPSENKATDSTPQTPNKGLCECASQADRKLESSKSNIENTFGTNNRLKDTMRKLEPYLCHTCHKSRKGSDQLHKTSPGAKNKTLCECGPKKGPCECAPKRKTPVSEPIQKPVRSKSNIESSFGSDAAIKGVKSECSTSKKPTPCECALSKRPCECSTSKKPTPCECSLKKGPCECSTNKKPTPCECALSKGPCECSTSKKPTPCECALSKGPCECSTVKSITILAPANRGPCECSTSDKIIQAFESKGTNQPTNSKACQCSTSKNTLISKPRSNIESTFGSETALKDKQASKRETCECSTSVKDIKTLYSPQKNKAPCECSLNKGPCECAANVKSKTMLAHPTVSQVRNKTPCECPPSKETYECIPSKGRCECPPSKAPCQCQPKKGPCECTPNKGPCECNPNKGPCECSPNKGPCECTPNKGPCECTPNKGPCECSTKYVKTLESATNKSTLTSKPRSNVENTFGSETALKDRSVISEEETCAMNKGTCEYAPNKLPCECAPTKGPCECAPTKGPCECAPTKGPCECAPSKDSCECSTSTKDIKTLRSKGTNQSSNSDVCECNMSQSTLLSLFSRNRSNVESTFGSDIALKQNKQKNNEDPCEMSIKEGSECCKSMKSDKKAGPKIPCECSIKINVSKGSTPTIGKYNESLRSRSNTENKYGSDKGLKPPAPIKPRKEPSKKSFLSKISTLCHKPNSRRNSENYHPLTNNKSQQYNLFISNMENTFRSDARLENTCECSTNVNGGTTCECSNNEMVPKFCTPKKRTATNMERCECSTSIKVRKASPSSIHRRKNQEPIKNSRNYKKSTSNVESTFGSDVLVNNTSHSSIREPHEYSTSNKTSKTKVSTPRRKYDDSTPLREHSQYSKNNSSRKIYMSKISASESRSPQPLEDFSHKKSQPPSSNKFHKGGNIGSIGSNAALKVSKHNSQTSILKSHSKYDTRNHSLNKRTLLRKIEELSKQYNCGEIATPAKRSKSPSKDFRRHKSKTLEEPPKSNVENLFGATSPINIRGICECSVSHNSRKTVPSELSKFIPCDCSVSIKSGKTVVSKDSPSTIKSRKSKQGACECSISHKSPSLSKTSARRNSQKSNVTGEISKRKSSVDIKSNTDNKSRRASPRPRSNTESTFDSNSGSKHKSRFKSTGVQVSSKNPTILENRNRSNQNSIKSRKMSRSDTENTFGSDSAPSRVGSGDVRKKKPRPKPKSDQDKAIPKVESLKSLRSANSESTFGSNVQIKEGSINKKTPKAKSTSSQRSKQPVGNSASNASVPSAKSKSSSKTRTKPVASSPVPSSGSKTSKNSSRTKPASAKSSNTKSRDKSDTCHPTPADPGQRPCNEGNAPKNKSRTKAFPQKQVGTVNYMAGPCCGCNPDKACSGVIKVPKETETVHTDKGDVILEKCCPKNCGKVCPVTPCQVSYAHTVVSKFENYTIYEVTKQFNKKPRNMSRVTEGVFVVKCNKKV